eukprot:1161108-Pelagomonas_calceolata.AAC.4
MMHKQLEVKYELRSNKAAGQNPFLYRGHGRCTEWRNNFRVQANKIACLFGPLKAAVMACT